MVYQGRLIKSGTEAILPVMQTLLNFAMKQGRTQYLQAEPYERSEDRIGHANGFKPMTLQTRMGSMTVEIPLVYRKIAPDCCKWLDENLAEGLTVFSFPTTHWRKIRTTIGLERLNREIRRRTRVATLFPNKESCLRLVTSIVEEIHEDWMAGRKYLSILNNAENAELPNYRKEVA